LRPAPSDVAQHHVTNRPHAGFRDPDVFARTEAREARTNSPRHFFTAAEQAGITTAFDSATRHDWKAARRLAASTAGPVARKLIEWQ
ncbi:hypothetical protein ACSTLM_01175, partial [Vibrio parahaemolyticus]